MKLSERLQSVASLIDKCETVADIGTDHAYLAIYLIERKICSKVVASDLRKEPAQKAEKNIYDAGFEDLIQVRIGDGLSILKPDEANVIVIAGMGGLLIARILGNSKYDAEKNVSFILQPMTHHIELRKWLANNSYVIIDEELIKENGKIHLILKVKNSAVKINEDNIHFGRILFEKKHPLLVSYIQKYIDELQDVKTELLGKNTAKSINKLTQVEKKIQLFTRIQEDIYGK